MNRSEANVGMLVIFGRRQGEKTLGRIVKCNPKKAKVEPLESRGTLKDHSVGTVWTVPYSLMMPQSAVASAPSVQDRVSHTPSLASGWEPRARVQFTATRGKNAGRRVVGTVKRVNSNTITITPDEPAFPGEYWLVSPGVLSPAS